MSRYIIAPDALQDLKEISEYFYPHAIEAGESFLQRFNQKCRQLVQFPKSGKSYANIRPNLRGVLLDEYVIFYSVTDDEIQILRVVNGRRNLNKLFPEAESE